MANTCKVYTFYGCVPLFTVYICSAGLQEICAQGIPVVIAEKNCSVCSIKIPFTLGTVHFNSGPFQGTSLIKTLIMILHTNKHSLNIQSLLGGVKKEGDQIMQKTSKR